MTTVWYASVLPLQSEAVLSAWIKRLPQQRQERVQRLRSEEAKRLSVGAWALLLEAYRTLGVDVSDWTPLENPHGKPYFQERTEFQFSLSHSGQCVLCALSDAPVGCDVERIRPFDKRVANRFFSAEENRLLEQAEDKSELFTRIWTCKESYVKAIGTGLSTPLSSFSTDPTATPPTLKRSGDFKTDFSLVTAALYGEYRMAVCTKRPIRSVSELPLWDE